MILLQFEIQPAVLCVQPRLMQQAARPKINPGEDPADFQNGVGGPAAKTEQVDARRRRHSTLAGGAAWADAEVRLSARIAAKLQCPTCFSALQFEANGCHCAGSNRHEFPLRDGVPVLLDPKESIFDPQDVEGQGSSESFSLSALKDLATRLLPTLGKNIRAKKNYRTFAEMLSSVAASPKVLVVGGATAGTGFESILASSDIELVESDVYLGPRTALVCDAHRIPFEDGAFEGVIAQAVLEHVVDPQRCVDEIHRVLRPKGLVYADTPFMQQVHAGALDFTRFTHLGHRRLFRRFEEVSSGASCGPATALAWAYQHFLLSFVKSKPAGSATIALARLTGFWLKYLDYFLVDRPGAIDSASAYYFLGIKSAHSLSDQDLLRQYRGLQRA